MNTTRFTVILLAPMLAGAAELSQGNLRTAAQKGLELLVKTSPTFIKKGGCNSCHAQFLPAAAQAFARERGIVAGETIEQLPPEVSETTTERYIEYSATSANSQGYELFAHAAAKRPLDARIESQIYLIRSFQEPEGYWRTTGNRPPLTYDDYTTTAYAIHALKMYTPASQRADSEARIARARSWLLEAKPQLTQERAFQLLGLAWSGAGRESLEKAAKSLQAMQRRDGGWSQQAAMPSDAYATGLALWALNQGGVSVGQSSYQAGLRYLLDTQAKDGTWHVKARALPVQPYFESGYPYGPDQWISAAGAAYATMAIAAAVEPERAARR